MNGYQLKQRKKQLELNELKKLQIDIVDSIKKKPKQSRFKLKPYDLIKALEADMLEYLTKDDKEFNYDRFAWLKENSEWPMTTYDSENKYDLLTELYTCQETINVLIQQYLRFGKLIQKLKEI